MGNTSGELYNCVECLSLRELRAYVISSFAYSASFDPWLYTIVTVTKYKMRTLIWDSSEVT